MTCGRERDMFFVVTCCFGCHANDDQVWLSLIHVVGCICLCKLSCNLSCNLCRSTMGRGEYLYERAMAMQSKQRKRKVEASTPTKVAQSNKKKVEASTATKVTQSKQRKVEASTPIKVTQSNTRKVEASTPTKVAQSKQRKIASNLKTTA